MTKTITKFYGVFAPTVLTFEPVPNNPQLLRVTRQSDLTRATNTQDLPITEQQLRDWLDGSQLIQQVMPHLTTEQREFLMSGATQEEWTAVFGGGDEDDED